MEIILAEDGDKHFTPFDRFAMFDESKGKSLSVLLHEFASLRAENLEKVRAQFGLSEKLDATGIHPAFGEVTLAQLLSTWVVHDLNHLGQIARVMANQYRLDVGPWIPYLGILNRS
jgi:hypothetical protein